TGVRKRTRVTARPKQVQGPPQVPPNTEYGPIHYEVSASPDDIDRPVSLTLNTGIVSTTSTIESVPVSVNTNSGNRHHLISDPIAPKDLPNNSNRQGSGILMKESSGFYGPTSFASIFLENQGNFSSTLDNVGEDGEEGTREPWHPTFVNGIPATHAQASIRLDMGIRILGQLPSQDICRRLIQTHYWPTTPIPHHTLTEYIITSTWSVYGNYLQEQRDSRGLGIMAKQVFLNEQVPLQPNESSIKYLESFTGHNLRWETIGLMFTFFGIAALALNDRDKLFATQPEEMNNRMKFAICMKQCSEACMVLCDHTDTINDIVLCLLSRLLTLQSTIDGDTSYLLWRRHGELVAALTALGIHREVDPGAASVSLFSELRKRLFIAVYINDKAISSFSGRPPLLSRRYTTCQLPLDLSDQCLMAEDMEEMRREVSQLDEHGWNVHGEVHPATCSRNDFLLEQISTRERHSSGQQLLDTARQILATVVILWVQRDRLVEYQNNFTWLITSYGVPSSGVLCIEMLKQTKHTHNSQLNLPRSEVIQNLSMFIGFLAWVRPADGNYLICVRMRKIFQHVLDRVLEPAREDEQDTTQPVFEVSGAQDNFMNFSMGDTEFVDWLDTIDWGKGPWMD
ncbi:MAG: hypothetical protein Q9187_007973, partial [Circinaria calcarea]